MAPSRTRSWKSGFANKTYAFTSIFSCRRLWRTVRTNRRPAPADKHTVAKFGEVEVDLDRQIVTRAGAPVEVSPQEFRVLRLFLQSGGRALSRDDILARCWGAEYEGTPRTVDNFFRSLRVKLEVNAEEPRHFLTVRGHGYRFEK